MVGKALPLSGLERLRDRTFRREPARRVRGEKTALAFVTEVGFCFTLSDFGLPVPCLWVACCGRRHPRRPVHTHHDPAIGLAWRLKDDLAARRLVYYGKLVRGKPTLVALDLFPAFCRVIRDGRGSGDYLLDYRSGTLSRPAATILDVLHEEGPQYTPDLRRRVGLVGARETGRFEAAIGELQRKLWIVKTEERYDPDFCYRWDLLDRWLEGPLRASRDLSREEAVRALVARYAGAAIFATEARIASLLGLSRPEVDAAVRALAAEGTVLPGCEVRGLPGTWLVSAVMANHSRSRSRSS